MAKHLDLKDILHRVVESLDLNPMHRAELHDAIDIHDDPAAQAAKDAEKNDERDAQVKELEEKLAALRPAPAPEPATPDVSRETDSKTLPANAKPAPVPPAFSSSSSA